MGPIADALEEDQAEQLVAHYASLPAAAPAATQGAGEVERGRHLAQAGDGARGIPPCLSCHGPTGSPQFPRLSGQNAAYLERQLALWRAGGRAGTTYGQIMAPIARRLTDDQVREVAAYFASRPQGQSGLSSDARGETAP
jgi:cytochrome c553